MSFNPFVIRKNVILLFLPLITSVSFFVGLKFYGFAGGLGFLGGGLLISYFIGWALFRNPFQMLLEGKGLLAINMDSTGILKPFIVGIETPFIKGRGKMAHVKDVFNRDSTFMTAAPEKAVTPAKISEDGSITIKLTSEELNRSRFGMFHYPTIIWNEQIKATLTKEMLSNMEKEAFAEQQLLFLNRHLDQLTSNIRDFARYVVNQLNRETGGLFQNKWTWIVLGIGFFLLAILLFPKVLEAFQSSGAAGTVKSVITNTGQTGVQVPITP